MLFTNEIIDTTPNDIETLSFHDREMELHLGEVGLSTTLFEKLSEPEQKNDKPDEEKKENEPKKRAHYTGNTHDTSLGSKGVAIDPDDWAE